MAAIWLAVQPISARRRAVALRRPCAETSGHPASSHNSRNQLPKPGAVFALAASGQPDAFMPWSHYTGIAQSPANYFRMKSDLFRDSAYIKTIEVLLDNGVGLDRVEYNERTHFSGPIYTLETMNCYYIAGRAAAQVR
jgi:hypothetical protein